MVFSQCFERFGIGLLLLPSLVAILNGKVDVKFVKMRHGRLKSK